MSDQLKKFIQQHKSEFDNKLPDPKLFDKIMSEMHVVEKKQSNKVVFLPVYKKMVAAASVALVICSATFIYLERDQNNKSQLTQSVENLTAKPIEQVVSNEIQSGRNLPNVDLIPNVKSEVTITSSKKSVQSLNVKKNLQQSSFIVESPVALHATKPNAIVSGLESQPQTQKLETAMPNQSQETTLKIEEVSTSLNEIAVVESNSNSIKNSIDNRLKNIAPDATNPNSKDLSIGKYVRGKFYRILSKKASKWTNDALHISSSESEDHTKLAIQYKSEKIEFNKSVSIPILGQ